METVHFYAPNLSTHHLFDQDTQATLEISNNFTFWVVRPYIFLKNAGFPCKIVDYIPKRGILIADRDTLGDQCSYFGDTMLICAKGDREFHPSAYLHVIQNPTESSNPNNSIWNTYHISPWPQPHLIPRLAQRGSRVENIAFMGTRSNITPELSSDKWIDSLAKLGCNWKPIFTVSQWHDYTDIDVIVAIRSFDGNLYTHKPASKLINCWHALVPAVLTPESAYISLRQSELDFCLVNSLDDLIESITYLKNNPEFYLSMIEHGKLRAREFDENKIAEQWLTFFQDHVVVQYRQWLNMPEYQKRYLFLRRYAKLKQSRLEARVQRLMVKKR